MLFLFFKRTYRQVKCHKTVVGLIERRFSSIDLGKPIDTAELKSLLAEALKIDECVRIVRVQKPIPLRFRRGITGEKFQCVITLE